MTGDDFCPVLARSPIFRLKQQPAVPIAEPELRLAAKRFDRLRARTINRQNGKLAHAVHSTGFVPRIIASTSALAASPRGWASAFSRAISAPPRREGLSQFRIQIVELFHRRLQYLA